jgi:hypothetical protein
VAKKWEMLITGGMVALPDAPMQLPAYIASRRAEIEALAAPFIRADKPAFNLMVKKNIRYAMNLEGDAWNKVWAAPEGRETLIAAIEEAFIIGATLPDMGCLVPYNGTAEFIPAVEAYEFAATTGATSPFLPGKFRIETIYEKDQYHISRKDGKFSVEFDSILSDRGKPIAVAVYGTLRSTGETEGEVYPAARLLEKAKAHSPSYRQYAQDLLAFEAAKMEGRVKLENGREYIEKVIPKRDGGTWTKKIFHDELSNPYDGPDAPEMLRKTAGKSFLTRYMRVRNSTAAVNEVDDNDDPGEMLGEAMVAAFTVVPGEPETPPDPPPPDDDPDDEEPPAAAPAPVEPPKPAPKKPNAARTKEEVALF